jgi:hypothetical protein
MSSGRAWAGRLHHKILLIALALVFPCRSERRVGQTNPLEERAAIRSLDYVRLKLKISLAIESWRLA